MAIRRCILKHCRNSAFASTFTLAEAIAGAREPLAEGLGPIEVRRARDDAARFETAKATTFRQCAADPRDARRAMGRPLDSDADASSILGRWYDGTFLGRFLVSALHNACPERRHMPWQAERLFFGRSARRITPALH
ncbi:MULTISPECIES: hypothetical protein [Methylobacterium]|uniref:hypothetical protein n=1 Tax=Methylobacterium TaxID=407 RepID=UPI0013EBEC2B|nr:hypothetical protein [Methylobacterium sp. DB0501]NGM37725.1 hypothetical protein [Methylobacterium sp. DB0501]